MPIIVTIVAIPVAVTATVTTVYRQSPCSRYLDGGGRRFPSAVQLGVSNHATERCTQGSLRQRTRRLEITSYCDTGRFFTDFPFHLEAAIPLVSAGLSKA